MRTQLIKKLFRGHRQATGPLEREWGGWGSGIIETKEWREVTRIDRCTALTKREKGRRERTHRKGQELSGRKSWVYLATNWQSFHRRYLANVPVLSVSGESIGLTSWQSRHIVRIRIVGTQNILSICQAQTGVISSCEPVINWMTVASNHQSYSSCRPICLSTTEVTGIRVGKAANRA